MSLRVLDLRKPEAVQTALLSLTATDSYSGLVADGDTLLTSHFTGSDALGVATVYAFGDQALLIGQSDIAVIDASTPSAPKLARQLPLIATPQYVDVRGDQALLTLGTQGVQWLSLK